VDSEERAYMRREQVEGKNENGSMENEKPVQRDLCVTTEIEYADGRME
jgi:hypothetical protein